jgi:hypothetical protein
LLLAGEEVLAEEVLAVLLEPPVVLVGAETADGQLLVDLEFLGKVMPVVKENRVDLARMVQVVVVVLVLLGLMELLQITLMTMVEMVVLVSLPI